MAKGKLKRIDNQDPRFGANTEYLCLKVQADYSSGSEEYLLLTDKEFESATARGESNPEDTENLKLGVLTVRENKEGRFGSAAHYHAVKITDLDGNIANLLLTEAGLETIRKRSESNPEDIEANKTGWLADLFD
jgi:hypothetical protein|tara:strand:- start:263 stop:664 length:402 start_codon:yes stop_codon:yes gene_type:complete